MTTTADAATGRHRPVGSDAAPGRRTAVWLGVAALVYVGSVVAMVAVDVALGITTAAAVVQLAMMGAGAAIAVRSYVPRLGWLLVATGATLNYWIAVDEVPVTSDLVVLAQSVTPLTVLPFMLVLATFPNARPVTRLGRWVVRFAVATGTVSVLLMVAAALDLVGGEWAAYRRLFDVAVIGTVVGAAVNHVRTYRGRPRVEQLQLKYFVLVLFVGVFQLLGDWAGVPGAALLDSVMPGVISVTILLAITRYRLYEIDRIISRTVAYALVVATLAVLGIGGVTVVTALLPTQDRLAVALSTVAVVVLFDPLRRRIVDLVDRRFDRTRYVARRVVEGFGRDVRDITDVEEIGQRVHAVVSRTVAPTTVAVWQPDRGAT